MRNVFKLFVLLIVVMLSCDEDEFSPQTITISENEGWGNQLILLEFDNPEQALFLVQFDKYDFRPLATSKGLYINVPSLDAEKTYLIRVKTPKGWVVVTENFLIKSSPYISYASSTTFSYRVPLKVVVKNNGFYSEIDSINFCEPAQLLFCSTAEQTISGDTLILRGSMKPGDYWMKVKGKLSFQIYPDNGPIPEVLSDGLLGRFTYRSSFFLMTTSEKAGGNLDILLNDSKFFPSDLVITMNDENGVTGKAEIVTFDVFDEAGYVNAMVARFRIPALPAGKYTVTVNDENGLPFLPEKSNVFTITN